LEARVVLKTFEDSHARALYALFFANVKIMSFIKKNLESAVPLHGIDKLDQIVPGKINVLNLWKEVDLNLKLTMKGMQFAATDALKKD
jgi:4-hydroxythreonine-4-phosphate dehydrogenase